MRNSNELRGFESELFKLHKKYLKATIKGIKKDLKRTNKELDNIIKSGEKLTNLFDKTTSVTGVEKVTALFFISYTNI